MTLDRIQSHLSWSHCTTLLNEHHRTLEYLENVTVVVVVVIENMMMVEVVVVIMLIKVVSI